MRYIEYIYLIATICLMVFLGTMYTTFTTLNWIAVMIGILVTSFMYSFRRRQRIFMQLRELEEEEALAEAEKSELQRTREVNHE